MDFRWNWVIQIIWTVNLLLLRSQFSSPSPFVRLRPQPCISRVPPDLCRSLQYYFPDLCRKTSAVQYYFPDLCRTVLFLFSSLESHQTSTVQYYFPDLCSKTSAVHVVQYYFPDFWRTVLFLFSSPEQLPATVSGQCESRSSVAASRRSESQTPVLQIPELLYQISGDSWDWN